MPEQRAFPEDGLGLHDFMRAGTLEVEEPDWIHARTPQSRIAYPLDVAAVREAILDNLTLVHDPELPVNIVDLGLVYRIDVTPDGHARVEMTLTAPNCPVAGAMPAIVEKGVLAVPGIVSAKVELVWEPAWTIDRASDDARLALGM
jgi:FeS assembly SUF system protein